MLQRCCAFFILIGGKAPERSKTANSLSPQCYLITFQRIILSLYMNKFRNSSPLAIRKVAAMVFCLFPFFNSSAQVVTIKPDLSKEDHLHSVNRQVSLLTNREGKTVVHLKAKEGAGVAWINDLTFSTGIIELDVKGKDVLQESFVGISFHGVNDSTYESIYFRPFNFQVDDPVRRKHAVQYISLPMFDWKYLRDTYPDKYEHPLLAFVDPNGWFHVKIVVTKDKIQAFVNSDVKACLSVEPLTTTLSGNIGFWVGHRSDGDFANLVIRHDK